MNFDIKYFDPSNMKRDAICLFMGRRRTGKSTLVTDIMSYHRDIPTGVVISGSEETNDHWGSYIHPYYIHSGFDESVTVNMMKSQKKKIKRAKKRGMTKDEIEEDNSLRCFAIYDDIMFDPSLFKAVSTRKLFMNGRHSRILFMLTAQYMMDLPTWARTNIDYIFILKEPIYANKKRIYENFCGIFPQLESFSITLDALTEDYECMVVDNTVTTSNVEDMIYYYKATPDLQYRLGSEAFWNYGVENYDPEYSSEESDDDGMKKKKKKKKVTVTKEDPYKRAKFEPKSTREYARDFHSILNS